MEPKLSKVLRRAREEEFNEWWSNYSPTGFPSEVERRAFLAGFDRAIELAEKEEVVDGNILL